MRSRSARYPLQAIVFAVFAAPLAVLLSSSHLSAQVTTADIVGTVTDASGAVLPGATITVENLARTRKCKAYHSAVNPLETCILASG